MHNYKLMSVRVNSVDVNLGSVMEEAETVSGCAAKCVALYVFESKEEPDVVTVIVECYHQSQTSSL
jgi:hypothetical protein